MKQIQDERVNTILEEVAISVNELKLRSYIEKVIAEAALAEQRPNDVQYQFLIIENDLLFAIKSQYQRVCRRIEYRLLHNIKRNFGLRFNLVWDSGYNAGCFRESRYRIYDPENCIDANNALMEWCCFGCNVIIISDYGLRPYNELGLPHLNKLLECGYDYKNLSDNKNWTKFKTAYEKAYGEIPLIGFLKMKKAYCTE